MANPFLDNPFLAMRAASNPFLPSNAYPPLAPEVEDSLLSQLAGGGLSALGYVGSTLDKPGAALRGLLAGQPDQLLNLIPFSDALGITDEADRVSGRDLLEQYGMLAPNTPGLDWGDVGGFGAEVLLDPLTYLTFGGSALTKAGRAADAAGDLARGAYGAGGTLLKGARQAGIEAGQRGLVGVGLPFAGTLENVLGFRPEMAMATGPWAHKVAGVLDTTGDWLRYGNPVGLTYGQLFGTGAKGAPDRLGQIGAKRITELERAGEAAAMKDIADPAYALLSKGGLGGDPADIAAKLQFIEGDVPLPQHLQHLAPELVQLRDAVGPALRTSELEMGIPVPSLQDAFQKNYFPRLPAEFADESIADYNARVFSANDPFATGRKDVLKNIPGNRDTINRMTTDPMILGKTAAATNPLPERAKYIRERYLGLNDKELQSANNTLRELRKQLTKAADENAAAQIQKQIDAQAAKVGQLAYTFKKSVGLADYLAGLDERHLTEGVGLFPNDPLYDAMQRMISAGRAKGRAQGIYEVLGKESRMTPEPGDVPLMEVVRKAGLGKQLSAQADTGVDLARTKLLAEQALGTPLDDAALAELSRLQSLDTADMVDEATQGALAQLQKVMGHKGDPELAFVPKEVESLITQTLKATASPGSAAPVMAFVDKFTAAFKVGQLAWPARIVRDLYSAAFMNWVDGGLSWRGATGAFKIATQGSEAVIDGARQIPEFAKMSDKQATVELLKEMFSQKVIAPYGGMWQDINASRVAGTQVAGELPGGVPMTMKRVFVEPWQQEGALDPRKIRGLGTKGRVQKTTQFAYAKNFENMSHFSDIIGRAGPYIEYRMQGLSPEVAAAKVKLAQVDYSELSAFEKTWMKRLVPFYTFSRRMMPKVFKELIEKPGGRLGQTIRAENLSRDDQFLPPYLAPGLAIRLPESLSSGTDDARYLTSIDLPHESVFQLFRPSNTTLGTFENTGMGLLGQMHPLIKAPMEMAVGKQFYSGRDLADLDSRIGRIIDPNTPPDVPIALDQVLMNSPLSRLISTIGTAFDPRKGWGALGVNALSGVRVSDVDVERSKDRIARDAIQELMQGNEAVRTHTNMYVPRELMSTLTPDKQMLMAEYNMIQQRAKQRAAEKRPGAGRL